MELKLSKRFKTRMEGRIGKYDFRVGILEDGPHKEPLTVQEGRKRAWKKDMSLNVDQAKQAGVIGSYAGGKIRKRSNRAGPLTIAQVSAANSDRLGFNYLSAPFKQKSADIIKFSTEFLKMAFGRSQKKRCENLLQAIVRNPILRGDYGGNSLKTQKRKGFDRNMIDTAQLFKAIKAVCRVKK